MMGLEEDLDGVASPAVDASGFGANASSVGASATIVAVRAAVFVTAAAVVEIVLVLDPNRAAIMGGAIADAEASSAL